MIVPIFFIRTHHNSTPLYLACFSLFSWFLVLESVLMLTWKSESTFKSNRTFELFVVSSPTSICGLCHAKGFDFCLNSSHLRVCQCILFSAQKHSIIAPDSQLSLPHPAVTVPVTLTTAFPQLLACLLLLLLPCMHWCAMATVAQAWLVGVLVMLNFWLSSWSMSTTVPLGWGHCALLDLCTGCWLDTQADSTDCCHWKPLYFSCLSIVCTIVIIYYCPLLYCLNYFKRSQVFQTGWYYNNICYQKDIFSIMISIFYFLLCNFNFLLLWTSCPSACLYFVCLWLTNSNDSKYSNNIYFF
jgi:hypothetical protein